jgi:hypothetical protein
MSERGGHTLTPAELPQGLDGKESCAGCLLLLLIFAFILYASLPPSPPAEPAPPPIRTAAFYSDSDPNPANHFAVLITGGSIAYQTVEHFDPSIIAGISGDRVFMADLNDRTSQGDLQSAEVIVLFGTMKLHVGDLDQDDVLRSRIVTGGGTVRRASFNLSAPPTGPPPAEPPAGPPASRRVIIVGALSDINLGDLRGRSQADLNVLELDPSHEELTRYSAEMDRYVHAMEAHQREMEQYERDHPGYEHPTEGRFHGK